ncbi:rRNA-processing protein sof1 [Cladochytrium tenue]|nr:rRNA-processing protein sof1 [Cladochytrium tenue]
MEVPTLPSPPPPLAIRCVAADEFAGIFLKWAHELRWNLGEGEGEGEGEAKGPQESELIPLAAPGGLFVGFIRRGDVVDPETLLPDERDGPADGEVPVACVVAAHYTPRHGFIGLYMVRNPALRGMRYGAAVFRRALEFLGPDCNVGLDGVPAQVANYRRYGFQLAWGWLRWTAPAAEADAADKALLPPPAKTASVADVRQLPLDEVRGLMNAHSGFERPVAYVATWLSHANIHGVALRSTDADGGLVAAGWVRPGLSAWRVGPVVAETAEQAEWVLRELVRRTAGTGRAVVSDLRAGDEAVAAVFRAAGFGGSNDVLCSRMWTAGDPLPAEARARLYSPVTLQTETSILASCGSDQTVTLHDLCTSKLLTKVVLAANEDHNLYTFDMRKLSSAAAVHTDHVAPVMDVDYSPTGQEFVTGGYDRAMRIFRAGAGLSDREIYHTGRMQRIFCVRYSMDARFVLSASDDGNVRLWKADASAKLGVMAPRKQVAADYRKAVKERFKHMPEDNVN